VLEGGRANISIEEKNLLVLVGQMLSRCGDRRFGDRISALAGVLLRPGGNFEAKWKI
jgi:hypothetical protein